MVDGATSIGLVSIAALATFLAALGAGCLPLWRRVRTNHRLLRVLTRFAAGFLIASAFVVAIPEGIELTMNGEQDHGHEHAVHSFHEREEARVDVSLTAGVALLLGFALMLVFESLGFGHAIHEEHHDGIGPHLHHPDEHSQRGQGLAKLVSLGLSVHAVADGIAIGAAFASGSQVLTLSLMLAMIMHKVPAAFSLAAFGQHTHADARQTLRDVVLFSLATPVAMVIAWRVLADLQGVWIGYVLLFSAGTFLYVATVDVLPHIIADDDRKQVALHVIMGALLLSVVIVLFRTFGLVTHGHG